MMKKFKKPLTISINEQQASNIESPKQRAKERQLLMYNQHTITSSINNQNQQNQLYQQYFENDKQQNNLQQQDQQNDCKNNYGGKLNENDNKNNRAKKINVVQFEQFTIHNEKYSQKNNMKSTLNTNNNNTIRSSNINNINNNNRRQFTIQIPENEQNKRISNFDLKSQNISNQVTNKRQVKQPPCPSHKSSVNFNNKKHFIFPVHDQQKSILFKKESQTKKTNNSFTQDDYNIKLRQINSEWQIKIQQLNKSFQKQRQQFYKQKSNLQKDLMIKDGQIQMLQKLITNRYQHKQDKNKNNNSNSNNQTKINQNQQPAYTTNNNIKVNQNQIEDKLNKFQTILLEKDLKNTQLLQKINELNKIIELKDEQIQTNRLTLIKQIKLTQSLKNQLFILQRKNSNEKLTKQFYKIKQIYQTAQSQAQKLISQNSFTNSQSSNNKTPKQLYLSKQKTQLDQFLAHSKSKEKKFNKKIQNTLSNSMSQHYQNNLNQSHQNNLNQSHQNNLNQSHQNNLNQSHQNNLNQSHQMRGIDDLHRRLQSLKMNRIQLQNRGKIKSQVGGYSQTTKYKPKGSFDFKGKYYEQTKSYPHNRHF